MPFGNMFDLSNLVGLGGLPGNFQLPGGTPSTPAAQNGMPHANLMPPKNFFGGADGNTLMMPGINTPLPGTGSAPQMPASPNMPSSPSPSNYNHDQRPGYTTSPGGNQVPIPQHSQNYANPRGTAHLEQAPDEFNISNLPPMDLTNPMLQQAIQASLAPKEEPMAPPQVKTSPPSNPLTVQAPPAPTAPTALTAQRQSSLYDMQRNPFMIRGF